MSERSWFSELTAVVASAPSIAELAGITVAFDVGGESCGIDLARRIPTTGVSADCRLVGSDDLFERLVRGKTTLQRAHIAGELELHGRPDNLLRLAYLFELTSSAMRS